MSELKGQRVKEELRKIGDPGVRNFYMSSGASEPQLSYKHFLSFRLILKARELVDQSAPPDSGASQFFTKFPKKIPPLRTLIRLYRPSDPSVLLFTLSIVQFVGEKSIFGSSP